MKTVPVRATMAIVLLSLVLNSNCTLNVVPGDQPTPQPTRTPTASPSPTATGNLIWYTTCGDPVCRGGSQPAPSGVVACQAEKEGQPCSQEGATCHLGNDCNQRLICARSDPKLSPGGCPISLKQFKEDIAYMQEEDVRQIYKDLLKIRLATYNYKDQEPSMRRLGFIINDNPSHFAVSSSGSIVDLYGYMSMAVAALQVQSREIQSMRQEIQELKGQECVGK